MLLDCWHGNAPDWDAIRARYNTTRTCVDCLQDKRQNFFTNPQWRASNETRVCRECVAWHRDHSEPWRCSAAVAVCSGRPSRLFQQRRGATKGRGRACATPVALRDVAVVATCSADSMNSRRNSGHAVPVSACSVHIKPNCQTARPELAEAALFCSGAKCEKVANENVRPRRQARDCCTSCDATAGCTATISMPNLRHSRCRRADCSRQLSS